jgi:hypothetical protein
MFYLIPAKRFIRSANASCLGVLSAREARITEVGRLIASLNVFGPRFGADSTVL